MSTDVVVSGVTYHIPDYGDTGWGQGSGNVQQLLIALAAVTATTPSFMQTVAQATSPASISSGKTYLVASNSLAVTLVLPTAAANLYFFVVDSGGNAFTNNITIQRAGSESINGIASNLVLNTNNGAWGFVCNGTNWFSLFGNLIKDDSDGHLYRITTVGGVITSQLVA